MPGPKAQAGDYTGTPTVDPSMVATPSIHENAPIEAFGGATAAATSGLGSAIEGAGKELFARAYALKQLDNESEAREADANYMIQAGKLHAAFNALEGKQRVDAYDDYAKNLQTLRTGIRDGLSNPMAQKMYDASSLSTMGRTIFNGAGSAAAAQKEYNEGSIKGQVDLDAKTVFDSPNDPGLFEEKVARVKASVSQLAAMKGFDENNPQTQDMQAKAISHMASQRILGMARNQPYQASKLFDEYKAKGYLFGDDVNVVEGKVQGFAQTVGAATIADQVLAGHKQGDGTYSASFEDMQAEARKKGADMFPNDPKMEIATSAAFDRNYNQIKWAVKVDQQDRQQQISSYITKGVTDPSLLPPSLVKQMTPTELKQFPAQANAYRHALDVQTNKSSYDQLLGMYNNDNAKFMDTNVYQIPGLNKSNIDFFVSLQRKAAANGDPRVDRAMTQIKSFAPAALDALGVTGPNQKRDVKNQFTGALHSAIQGWQEEYGKAPSPQDMQDKIYPSLMRQIAEPGWLWGTNNTKAFKSQIPAPILENATKALGHKPNPTEAEQIRNEYLRVQFNQFYKGSKAKLDERFPAK